MVKDLKRMPTILNVCGLYRFNGTVYKVDRLQSGEKFITKA